ncbi:hypothetical protein BC351_22195 [Paenibacillus ferrarius]|uniref:histidine kinase n=1 Tax=Paenibacillus ferrarius TaxID=1469647 RepID=A0A1V4HMZ7_9BACL|nr:ATP-binding protein [Paenibacillus ferrarius]OPH59041.1 hypothetical protein BC351_22195 [Paenibacillus ferrarius]
MINYFKDFILNVFLIYSPLAFYPYIIKFQNNSKLYRLMIFIVFAVAIVFTMSFPVNLYNLIYDFRSIPLLVGSLYGGIYVSVFLYATVLVCRFVIGSPNNLEYALAFVPTMICIAVFLKKYKQYDIYKKMITAILMGVFIKIVTFTIYLLLIHNIGLLLLHRSETLKVYILQGAVTALVVFLIEFLQNYHHMQEKAVLSDKIKIVSEMAASVAHEIRNPLTSVRGFIQLMGAQGLEQEKKLFYQKISLEELERAQMIITDYLAIAKPEPEKIEKINLHDEVQYVVHVLQTFANYHEVQINVLLQENSMFMLGDRNKLRQSLINIGKNAIEAMSADGGVLSISLSKQKNDLVLTITDTGIGMTQEQISRLGTPYFSTKEKGTGLGTMVSFSLLRAMKGNINVASEVGRGTIFEISFPSTMTE